MFSGHCGSNKEFAGFIPSKASKICHNIPVVVPKNDEKCSNCLSKKPVGGSPRSETMAASFSNMNLTNPIKVIVSKKRNRYKQDGFNLDLTYITDSIIAMGYPASNIESVYRNNIEDVVKFLDQKHQDHYMIYNLCSERSYDKTKFHNRVKDFPFDDHNPPKIQSVEPFCEVVIRLSLAVVLFCKGSLGAQSMDYMRKRLGPSGIRKLRPLTDAIEPVQPVVDRDVQEWLAKDARNVAVVHCKAGKGRTGTMICCYLLHSRTCLTADQALSLYGGKRTQDTKGVTIPSQVRYVRYYEQLLNKGLHYQPVTLNIKEFIFDPVPTFMGGPGSLSFMVWESFSDHKLRQKYKSDVCKIPVDIHPFTIKLDTCFRLTGDIKIDFYNKIMMRKEKLFHFWFNTFFVDVMGSSSAIGCEDCFELVFKKNELDKLSKKDKQHKIFSENFKLRMIVQKVSKSDHAIATSYPTVWPPLQDTTPTESSAGSSEESDDDDDWDSGEHNAELPLVRPQ
ncbi:hypothetical protein HUJ05_010546 [Dendroctonus ponderosae]|nr:hypothetical protein HUJ05_010546 [Dendroctonus ponderosae]